MRDARCQLRSLERADKPWVYGNAPAQAWLAKDGRDSMFRHFSGMSRYMKHLAPQQVPIHAADGGSASDERGLSSHGVRAYKVFQGVLTQGSLTPGRWVDR